MIKFIHNLIIAKKVLVQVNKKMEKDVAETCLVESYSNGREQGLSICQFSTILPKGISYKRVSFSEDRNSDNIAIYFGKDNQFNMSGNIPNEEIYHKAKLFRYDKIDEAAQFIVEFFAEGE
jgi:hypothetical protein